jgi:diguanylate cyclase (GGDEF)-like protein
MNSGVRRLADLRREASVAARDPQSDQQPLDARDLSTLLSVSSAVAAAPTLEELLDFAADTAVSALGAASVSISRWEIERELLRTLVNAGELAPGETRHPTGEIYRLSGDDPLKELLLGGRSYAGMLDDPGLHPLERSLLERLGKRSCAAVPIMLGDVAWGELWATRDDDRFDEHDLRMLGAIAGQVAAGVARAELFSRLSSLAFEDDLTGLANRAALQERMALAFDRLQDGWGEVTLLLCDVDNLRHLNDMRGHHGGDWALKAVGTALRREAEALPDALVCRLSGDEFCVLAEGAGPEQVQSVAAAAIDRLAAHRPQVSVSCGIASTRLGPSSSSELFGAADGALYAAKRAGRGGVSVAGAEPARSGRSIGRPGARRGRRDGLEVDTGTLITEGLALLDGALRAAAPLERLEGLATFVGSSLRASKAAVSLCAHGGAYVETLFKLDLRSGHSTSVRYGVDGDRYALADYPRTEELLVAGGSLHIHGNDPEADPAESTILDRLGSCDVLLAGAADGRGAWLLEIYGDVESADLALAAGVLRLLCAHAVHPAVGLRAERRATGSMRAVPSS